MPVELIDTLHIVEDLSTTEVMDSLLDELSRRGRPADRDPDLTPLEVAIQAVLLDKDLALEQHAEQYLSKPRSFEYFQTVQKKLPTFEKPTEETLRALEVGLDEWFSDHKRGSGCRVFVYPRPDATWFLVRHGQPFRRESSIDDGEPGSVAYRPLKYDVLKYDTRVGELGINAESTGEKKLYRKEIGRHLFGDEKFFPGTGKYTLSPLQEDGDASLVCSDIEGLDYVRLKEVHFYWGGAEGEIEIRKAKDVFATYARRGVSFPSARIIKAVFEVKFTDRKLPRSVCIKPSNVAQYTRDHDSVLIEEWLRRRGFVLSREAPADAAAETVLART